MSIGEPVARLDGLAKVTGAARYAADQYADGQVHAVCVGARIAAGAVERVDSSQAHREPGVVRVLTAADMPVVHPGFADVSSPPLATRFLPMQGTEIHYAGQPVAMVLADSLEAAGSNEAAAHCRGLAKSFVEAQAVLAHSGADELQRREGRVPLVHVNYAGLNAQGRERPGPADSQDDLLADSGSLVAAIKSRREVPILVFILRDVGIEQK